MKKAVFVGLVVAVGIGISGLALARVAGYDGAQLTPDQKAIDQVRKDTLMQSEELQVPYAQGTFDPKAISQVRRATWMECEHGQGLHGLYQGLYAQAAPGSNPIGELQLDPRSLYDSPRS